MVDYPPERKEALARVVKDPVLNQTLSLKSLLILRLCPVDVFFTATSTGLHGKTLKGLANKGYLNVDPTKDGLGHEYYLNNHGHRLRVMHVTELPPV
jgi:hypothetical protein